jgi:DNA-binding transcriptional ArsR family regulator
METTEALHAFAALSQTTRLAAFRLLVRSGPVGLAAGSVAAILGVPQNTLSTHLAILERAGLVASQRRGRSIVYRPVLERVRELTGFLVRDCCGGRPELCDPLVSDLAPCCSPAAARPTAAEPAIPARSV